MAGDSGLIFNRQLHNRETLGGPPDNALFWIWLLVAIQNLVHYLKSTARFLASQKKHVSRKYLDCARWLGAYIVLSLKAQTQAVICS
jgi:hypothetical protein